MQTVLLQLTVYLAAAVIAVPISQRLGFGSVLGYLAAGIAIGPVTHLVGVSETEGVRHYAEFGVVLMLFLIGLELRVETLWEMRHRLFGLGSLQVGLSAGAIALAAALLAGMPWHQAVAVGLILALSSTAIVLQTLSEKSLTRTEGGRASFAVLLFQDIAAIPLLAVLPLLLTFGAPGAEVPEAAAASHDVGHAAGLAGLSGWMRALLVVGVVSGVILAGRFLTRPVFDFFAMAKMQEIQTAGALLIVASIALLMNLLGFSAALGTFLAGVVLADSEYRHQLETDLAPFKGLLLGLFFITVGAAIDLTLLASEPVRILLFTLGMMAVKIAVLFALGAAFGMKERSRTLFALSLGQAGEFGFFLLAYSARIELLPDTSVGRLLLVISLSMALTPALFLLHDWINARRRPGYRPNEEIDETGTVIIVGLGRFGQVVNRMLRAMGDKTVVIDNEVEVLARMRRFGIQAYYGDLDRPGILESAGIAEASALVLALDDAERAVRISEYVRKRHPHVRIIARAHDRHHVYRLHAAGADHQVREVFDSAVRAGKYALEAAGHPREEVERIAARFVEHDRQLLAELAEVWDPETPVDRNPAYVARAREQAAAIAAELQGRKEPPAAAGEQAAVSAAGDRVSGA